MENLYNNTVLYIPTVMSSVNTNKVVNDLFPQNRNQVTKRVIQQGAVQVHKVERNVPSHEIYLIPQSLVHLNTFRKILHLQYNLLRLLLFNYLNHNNYVKQNYSRVFILETTRLIRMINKNYTCRSILKISYHFT